MHQGGNDHGRRDQGWIWLLAGTAEGVAIAAALIRAGWTVEVSVVTASAARAYADLAVAALHQGPLDGDASIKQVLARRPSWVVDATHPFALQISAALHRVCGREGQRLLRFERRTDVLSRTGSASADVPASVRWLERPSALADQCLGGHHLFVALGSRHLAETARAGAAAGATLFARVMPSCDGVRQALAVGLAADHLAVVHPRADLAPGAIEAALCRRWRITDVICRESGGLIEGLWRNLAAERGIQLWFLRRPEAPVGVEVVRDLEDLISRVNDDGLQGADAGCDDGG